MKALNSEKFHFTYLTYIKRNKRKLYSGYRDISIFKNKLPLIIRSKILWSRRFSKSGRSLSGRITVNTKSALKKIITRPSLNYSFRRLEVGFFSNLVVLPFINKVVSLFQNSSGSYSYIPATSDFNLFILTRMKSLLRPKLFKSPYTNYINLYSKKSIIDYTFFTLRQLPKNKFVSLLELFPGKGVQYVRSPGSKSKIIRMDSRTNVAVIKLPSDVTKIFSTYSIGYIGRVLLQSNTIYVNNKAGYYSIHGKKSKVRGVAKNPVDHPHGGRTKAIRYPRTPWGKTTKYK